MKRNHKHGLSYSPEYRAWQTRKVNDRNRRSNRLIAHNGVELTLAEWAERTGIRSDTIKWRIDSGWTIADALSTPARDKMPNRAGRRNPKHERRRIAA
jgi:uncharacterized protein YjcR